MPINYSKYPPDWEDRRQRILIRDKNRCRFCGIKNNLVGWRDPKTKVFHELPEGMAADIIADELEKKGIKIIKIVLTIAHMDHDPENWNVKDNRLAALCQMCHNQYDLPMRTRKRLESKNKNQTKLF